MSLKLNKRLFNFVFDTNPFNDILYWMIHLYMVPYSSVADIVKNQKDKRKFKRMCWIFVFLCLSLLRILLITVFYDGGISFFLLSYFNYEINGRAFHFSVSILWASAIAMCKSHCLSIVFFLIKKKILIKFLMNRLQRHFDVL